MFSDVVLGSLKSVTGGIFTSWNPNTADHGLIYFVDCQDQGLANDFCKGPVSRVFRFHVYIFSVAILLLFSALFKNVNTIFCSGSVQKQALLILHSSPNLGLDL